MAQELNCTPIPLLAGASGLYFEYAFSDMQPLRKLCTWPTGLDGVGCSRQDCAAHRFHVLHNNVVACPFVWSQDATNITPFLIVGLDTWIALRAALRFLLVALIARSTSSATQGK